MEKFRILYEICLSDSNINNLLDVIQTDIKLKEKSIPKCAAMMRDIMRNNINRCSRVPRNKEEYKGLVRHLNKLCVSEIVSHISKKYPDLQITRKIQVGKEQMRRNRDVFGDRQVHVQNRPYIRSRREYDDDESFHSMRPNDIGIDGNDSTGAYAPAFGNHMITNIPFGQKQPTYNTERNDNPFEMRYQQMLNDRNYSSGPQRPESPDFTLDGSGDKVRQEKMMRKMQEQMNMGGMNMAGNMGGMCNGSMNGMMSNGMPGGMCNVADDPYASLLAAGAPSQNLNQVNPYMGMGNPLMPMSSTNTMADNLGFNSMNGFSNGFNIDGQQSSAKTVQLTNDYEKKLAERRMIDLETNQPQTSNQNNGNQSMPGMQIPGMQMSNMYGNMQMPGMQQMPIMSGMQMNGIPNMQMSNMPSMQMNGVPNMQMSNMPGMQMSGVPNMQATNMFIPNMQI